MPEATIVTLAAGPGGAPGPARRAPSAAPPQFRGLSGVIITRPSRRSVVITPQTQLLAMQALGACESPEEAQLATHSLVRLATLTLSRKLGPLGDSVVGAGERRKLLRDAGVPGILYANPATEAIFASSAENLGKGGFLGQVSKAISNVGHSISVDAKSAEHFATGVLQPVAKAATDAGQILITDPMNLATNLVGGLTQGLSSLGTNLLSNPQNLIGLAGAVGTGGASLGLGDLLGGGGEDGSETEVDTSNPDDSDEIASEIAAESASANASQTNWMPIVLAGGAALVVLVLLTRHR